MAALGELEHPPGPVDVDRPYRLQLQLEGHRGGAVHDLAHPLREPVETTGNSEPRAGHVASYGGHPLGIRVAGTEQAEQRTPHARTDVVVVGSPHERVDMSIGPLEVPGEQLHPHKSGRPCQQHGIGCSIHSPPRPRHGLKHLVRLGGSISRRGVDRVAICRNLREIARSPRNAAVPDELRHDR